MVILLDRGCYLRSVVSDQKAKVIYSVYVRYKISRG